MNDWYRRYVGLMLRTRWLSIPAALVLLFLSGAEFVGFFVDWSYNEIALSIGNNLENVLLLLCLGILVLALVFRIFVLTDRDERKYLRHVASWVAVVVPIVAFVVIWDFATQPIPSKPCDKNPGEMCFGIYVFYRSPPLIMVAPVFIVGSFLRSVATFVVATLNVRKKLK